MIKCCLHPKVQWPYCVHLVYWLLIVIILELVVWWVLSLHHLYQQHEMSYLEQLWYGEVCCVCHCIQSQGIYKILVCIPLLYAQQSNIAYKHYLILLIELSLPQATPSTPCISILDGLQHLHGSNIFHSCLVIFHLLPCHISSLFHHRCGMNHLSSSLA